MKRYYLAIEGIDGSGKTTTINYIREKYYTQVDIYQRTFKPDWIKPLMNSKAFKRSHAIQIVVYLYLAHYNYWAFQKKDNGRRIVIMDRCFLSNICYFFPSALDSGILRQILLIIEPRIIPDKIFILDVDPEVAWRRDNCSKDLDWLRETRKCYKKSGKLKEFAIDIISPMSEIDGAYLYISKSIEDLLH